MKIARRLVVVGHKAVELCVMLTLMRCLGPQGTEHLLATVAFVRHRLSSSRRVARTTDRPVTP